VPSDGIPPRKNIFGNFGEIFLFLNAEKKNSAHSFPEKGWLREKRSGKKVFCLRSLSMLSSLRERRKEKY
jgi:hypothetical protein